MHRPVIIMLMIALFASACTLSNAPADQTILTEAPTTVALDSAPTRTPISTEDESNAVPLEQTSGSLDTVNTTSNNTTNINTNRDTQTVVCNQQTGWNTYTVVAGDTLFGIAQRANSTVDTLVSANCLVDAGLIEVGQVLYVPNPVQPKLSDDDGFVPDNNTNNNSDSGDTPNNDPNRYTTELWWIVQGDSANGFRVGCGDALLPQQSGIPTNLSIEQTMVQAFQYLTDDNNIGAGQADRGWWNPISQTNIVIDHLSVAKSHAAVSFTGNILRSSACGDAQMEAQIAMNVLSLTGRSMATIHINGQNMRDYFSASGASNQTMYTTSEFQNGAGEIAGEPIQYWVGQEGFGAPTEDIVVGCDSYITPIDVDNLVSGDLRLDIEIALQSLIDPNRWIPDIYTQLWKNQNVTIESVTVNGSHVDVQIGGQVMAGGVCSDPILEGQFIQTIFQFGGVQSAKVMNGDRNLRQFIDQSGRPDVVDYVYTRSNFP